MCLKYCNVNVSIVATTSAIFIRRVLRIFPFYNQALYNLNLYLNHIVFRLRSLVLGLSIFISKHAM